MSNRLPIPGQDGGTWGNILNAFLEVSLHNNGTDANNGTLNANTVGTSQIQNNSVTNTQLDVPTQTTLATVASKYTKPGGGIPASDLASAVQTNLTSASTAVQPSTSLSGDLGGTVASPIVAKINGINLPSGAQSTGKVIQATSTTATNWATVSSTTVSDATSSTKGIIQLDGDLAGTATSPTVAKVNGITVTGTPSANQVLTASSSSAAAWSTPAAGAGNATSSTPGLIQLDGDLGGSATSPSVTSINGITLPTSSPGIGNILTATSASATAWSAPAAGGAYITVAPPTGVVATDTANLTAALATCSTAGGGRVVCAAGTYVTNPLTLPANTIISGAGPQGTSIQLAPNSNADLLTTAGFSSYTGTTNVGISGFGLEDITLDANQANQTALSRCLVVYGYSYTLRNVWLQNGWGCGWYSEWGGNAHSMEAFSQDVKVINYGGTPGAVGIDWNGPHDSQFTNVIVSTLDSTIRWQDATYGTTPINGSSAMFPAVGTSFSFVTTSAAAVANYPTSGGSFIIPLATIANPPAITTVPQPLWAFITYTSASTSGLVTTFTGCTSVNAGTTQSVYVGSGANGIALPTYGIRTNMGSGTLGANGEIFTGCHIWGRNHFALYAIDSFFATNCYAEGAFIANVVLFSGCVWTGGIVMGTLGNTGNQPTEVGFCLGYGSTSGFGHARSNIIQGVEMQSFVYPGAAVAFANDAGGNIVQGMTDQSTDSTASAPSSLYTGSPKTTNIVQLFNWSNVVNGLFITPITTPGSSFQTFTQVSESISNVTISGSTVTVTTSTAFPSLVNGNQVYLSGITGVSSTTLYAVSGVTGATFSITQSGASWSTGGTITQSSFSFTVPLNCSSAAVTCISGGGGGQSGGVQASGIASVGGSGGGGGGISQITAQAAPTGVITINVGNGGTGGAAVATNSTAGISGTIGTQSLYGNVAVAKPGNFGAQGVGGAGGIGVTQVGGTGSTSSLTGTGPSTTAGASGGGGGGGGGGGISVANVVSNGSVAGQGSGGLVSGGAAGVSAAGGNGNANSKGGGGGGGGGAAATTGGFAGGNGANYGAGGGGGGAAQNGASSGAGGNGASGIVIVSTW
jgi:hypothetical protein